MFFLQKKRVQKKPLTSLVTNLRTRKPDDFAWRAKSRHVCQLGCYLLGLENVNAVSRVRFKRRRAHNWNFHKKLQISFNSERKSYAKKPFLIEARGPKAQNRTFNFSHQHLQVENNGHRKRKRRTTGTFKNWYTVI